jgi:hypothetical protein
MWRLFLSRNTETQRPPHQITLGQCFYFSLGVGIAASTVSRFFARIGSPCLIHGVRGASIARLQRAGRRGPRRGAAGGAGGHPVRGVHGLHLVGARADLAQPAVAALHG